MRVGNEFKKLQTSDSSYLRGKSHFEEDGAQNYLIFQPIYRYFKKISGVGSGDGRISSITGSDYTITLELSYYSSKIRVKLNGSCLKR